MAARSRPSGPHARVGQGIVRGGNNAEQPRGATAAIKARVARRQARKYQAKVGAEQKQLKDKIYNLQWGGGKWFKCDNSEYSGKAFVQKPIRRLANVQNETDKWDFLQQKSNAGDGRIAAQIDPSRGRTHRPVKRGGDKINNNVERLEVEAARQQRQAVIAKIRVRNQVKNDNRDGMNPISWQPMKGREVQQEKAFRSHSRKVPETNKRLQEESRIALRGSPSRFYSGIVYSQERKTMLVKEGVEPHVRKSHILGTGKGMLPSYGVADNFEHSVYWGNKAAVRSEPKPTAKWSPPEWWSDASKK